MATIQDIFDWLNQGAQGDIPGTGGSQPNAPAVSQSAQPQITPAAATPPPQQSNDRVDEAAARQRQRGYQAGQKAGQGLFGKPQQQPKTIDVDPDALPDFSGIGNLLSQYHTRATGGGTPADYSGNIPAELLPHYNALIQSGVPPDVAATILTQPSTGEGQAPAQSESGWPNTYGTSGWPYPYAGESQEAQAYRAGPGREQPLVDQILGGLDMPKLNTPMAEGDMQGTMDTSPYILLPNGQYVPTPPKGSTTPLQDMLSGYQSQGNPSSFWWNPEPGTYWGDEASGGG